MNELTKTTPPPAPTAATTVLVTGSSRGIGRAIALRLARDGHDIVVHCRSGLDQALSAVAEIQALGRSARVLQFDVADRAASAAALEADIEAHGAYYGVVCNAGIAMDNAFPAMTGEEWDRVVHTNLDAFYNVLHPLVMPWCAGASPGASSRWHRSRRSWATGGRPTTPRPRRA